MKNKAELEIKILFLVLWLCSITTLAYASGPGTQGKEVGENRLVPSVPVPESTSLQDGIPSREMSPSVVKTLPPAVPAVPSGSDFRYETSPLSAGNPVASPKVVDSRVMHGYGRSNERSVQPEASPALARPPSEQEISVLVDGVLSKMVNAGHGAAVSEALNYISNGNFKGLVDSQIKNPEILNIFIASLREISSECSADTPSKAFVDHWLSEAEEVQKNLLDLRESGGTSSDSLLRAMERLYAPIAKRILEIAKGFETASRVSEDSAGEEPLSRDFLKNFSAKARDFIVNSFNRAQTNLADEMISSPLEATALAAETATGQKSPSVFDQTVLREMTLSELYIQSRHYQVVDAVYIGKDFLYAQKMLHPPANLHPYLKWLLYVRNLTPRLVENYLTTRESVGKIYEQAKAGRGNIRYRGKVYGAFLPFSETAAGNYELVKPVSPE